MADPTTTTTTTTTAPPTPLGAKEVNGLCAIRGRWRYLETFFVDVLEQLFMTPAILEEPSLRELLWSGDQTAAIFIGTHYAWQPIQTKTRPAVITKRNALVSQDIGIGGNRGQGNPVNEDGNPVLTQLWVGSHTLFCMASRGAQAEILGQEVERHFVSFAPVLSEVAGFVRFRVLQVGELSVLEESHETFVVPITVGYAIQEVWTLAQATARLRAIQMSGCP